MSKYKWKYYKDTKEWVYSDNESNWVYEIEPIVGSTTAKYKLVRNYFNTVGFFRKLSSAKKVVELLVNG